MSEVYGNPPAIEDASYRYDAFDDGKVLFGSKGKLPPMGWNSWNAFGSGNTAALTKAMVDKIKELKLDEAGYKYVVLDDGCYKPVRVDGHLKADDVKFAEGFFDMSDYVHRNGLKFGLYNDIGSRLCSGAEVGIRGYEDVDTADYMKWGIDFIKVDNCYNVWDNATFSDGENARFTFAPGIKSISIKGDGTDLKLSAVRDGMITGTRAYVSGDCVTGIGTYDGTAPDAAPVKTDMMSSELRFDVAVETEGDYELSVEYATGRTEGVGEWLQLAVGQGDDTRMIWDDLLPATQNSSSYEFSKPFTLRLKKGNNLIRIMNHRRQENTLWSYAKIRECFRNAAPDKDIVFSICEWGKTQPHNWGYKVGDTWRILNDITFQVGADGDPGHGVWEGAYTTSVTAQYNKAVIMDEFAGLDKGWNDPDMLMIGMDGLDETMCKTHMTMWCMLNAPLMLGLDLRKVKTGDAIWKIISNKEVIALNQDALGVQSKRIFTTKAVKPDTAYIRDNDRIDVLAKPLADGSVALSFINVSTGKRYDKVSITKDLICEYIGDKMTDVSLFANAKEYELTDVWSGEKHINSDCVFSVDGIEAYDNITYKITPVR